MTMGANQSPRELDGVPRREPLSKAGPAAHTQERDAWNDLWLDINGHLQLSELSTWLAKQRRGVEERMEQSTSTWWDLSVLNPDEERLHNAVTALPMPMVGERWTYRSATFAWLRTRRSPHTRRAYLQDLADWLAWLDACDVDLGMAHRDDLDTYLACLNAADRPLSPATIARKLSALSSWYAYLADRDLVVHNPVAAVDRPTVARDSSPTVGLTVAEVHALLRATDMAVEQATIRHRDEYIAERNRLLVRLLVGLGLRVSEASDLCLADLLYNDGNYTVIIRSAGGRSRDLLIPASVSRYLDPYLTLQRRVLAHRQQVAREPINSLLFTTRSGRPLAQAYIYGLVRRFAQAAQIPANKISPRSLRRTAAAAALDNGVPLQDVQVMLGHNDPRTTRRCVTIPSRPGDGTASCADAT